MTTRTTRQSGIGVPLFSIPSSASWGIGEFSDLPAFASWCAAAGQRFVQLLPLNEISPGETSPYSSMSAMALDPIFIHVPAVPEYQAWLDDDGGGTDVRLDDDIQYRLNRARASATVRYADVRHVKSLLLMAAYGWFRDHDLATNTARAQAFHVYQTREAWWLDAYSTFRAIHWAQQERAWWEWPAGLAEGNTDAVKDARQSLADMRTYFEYLQWIAEGQWQEARRAAPVRVVGDLPFMISGDSPDVWCRRDQFRLDATVGVPPDAFSDSGQDWGLPPWRWDVMERTGFQWMRARARRAAALFDGVRIDHLVGLYRIYMRPLDRQQPKVFAPDDELTQSRLGAKILNIYLGSGLDVTAEDLGTVPDFVRWSMARLGVPGFKVMRWEREWKVEGQPFIDPTAYPESSVALSGTHDTEPLARWWRELSPADRAAFARLPSVTAGLDTAGTTRAGDPAALTPPVRDAILRALLGSTSRFVMLALQDVFGWDVRINTPATVSDANWTWKAPVPVDRWRDSAEWAERAAALGRWASAAGR